MPFGICDISYNFRLKFNIATNKTKILESARNTAYNIFLFGFSNLEVTLLIPMNIKGTFIQE